jgi:hypothetical protein
MDQARQLAQSQDLATKSAVVFNKRAQAAQEKLAGRVRTPTPPPSSRRSWQSVGPA